MKYKDTLIGTVILKSSGARGINNLFTDRDTAVAGFTDALHGLNRALQNLNRFDEAIEVALDMTSQNWDNDHGATAERSR